MKTGLSAWLHSIRGHLSPDVYCVQIDICWFFEGLKQRTTFPCVIFFPFHIHKMFGLNAEIHMYESSPKFGYRFALSSILALYPKELMSLFVFCFILRVDCLEMLTLIWVFYFLKI